MRRWYLCLPVGVLLLVSGCDDAPDPNFTNAMKARDEASAADAYAQLDSDVPRPSHYERLGVPDRSAFMRKEAGNLRATYESLLKQLDEDELVDSKSPVFVLCRPHFDQVLAFYDGNELERDWGSRGQALANDLRECHDRAAGSSGGAKAKATVALLRRFASAGMTLTGMTAVAHGSTDAGLPIWIDGYARASQDRPGFKLSAKSFLGY